MRRGKNRVDAIRVIKDKQKLVVSRYVHLESKNGEIRDKKNLLESK